MQSLSSSSPAVTVTRAFEELLELTEQRVRDGVRAAATLDMQAAHGRFWQKELGAETPIDQVDELVLERIASRPRLPPKHATRIAGPETLRKRLSSLKAAMRLQARRKRLTRIPEFPVVIAPRPPTPSVLSAFEDAIRLFNSLPLHRAEWYWLALWTGQRPSDVERMAWSEIDLRKGTMFVRSTKTRKPPLKVRIPLPLLEVLTEMARRPHRPDDHLVKPWPSRKTTLPLHCQKCGLTRMNATALRHTNLSWIAARTGITVALARYAGHTSTRMLEQTYAHFLPAQMRELTEALEAMAPSNDNAGGVKP